MTSLDELEDIPTQNYPREQAYPKQQIYQQQEIPVQNQQRDPLVYYPQQKPSVNITTVPTKNENDNNKQQNILHKIPKPLREPLLIIILFFILSTKTAKTTIGNYIPQINPDSSGNISYVGIFLYGVILALAYSAIKYLLELLS